MRSLLSISALVSGLLLFGAGCATTEPLPSPGSAAPSGPVAFGLTRPIGEDAAKSSAEQLSAYFKAKLGPRSSVKVFEDVNQLADALDKGTIDAAWLTPGAYVKATATTKTITPILKLSRGGATTYRSAFFTTAQQGGSLASFQGKVLALVAPGSMSGRLYPLAQLKKLGIEPKTYFARIVDGKDHKEVCEMVRSGRADLGATLSDDRDSIIATADGCREAGMDPMMFTVIAVTGTIPNDVIAVRADMNPETVGKLKQALSDLSADDAGKEKMKESFRADGFGPASDDDFKTVRELQSTMPGN